MLTTLAVDARARNRTHLASTGIDLWLDANSEHFKDTTTQNDRDNIDRYIKPLIGKRWLTEIKVATLNALYKHLSAKGRTKGNGNRRMYEYWLAHLSERDGAGPLPREIAEACGTKLDAAREAVRRYRRGRIPAEYSADLAPKSVRNVHVVIQLAFKDAVVWEYLDSNPAVHAVVPRARGRRAPKKKHAVWTRSSWAHSCASRYKIATTACGCLQQLPA